MDPNSGGILANGMFFPQNPLARAPAGYRHERYPYAEETSDPEGKGAWFGSVLSQTDLSVKFRMSLTSRWDSAAEWEMLPAGKMIVYALGLLHLVFSFLNACIYIVQELPLVIRSVVERHRKADGAASLSAGGAALVRLERGFARNGEREAGAGRGGLTLQGSAYLEKAPAIPSEPKIDTTNPKLHWDLFWACRMIT